MVGCLYGSRFAAILGEEGLEKEGLVKSTGFFEGIYLVVLKLMESSVKICG